MLHHAVIASSTQKILFRTHVPNAKAQVTCRGTLATNAAIALWEAMHHIGRRIANELRFKLSFTPVAVNHSNAGSDIGWEKNQNIIFIRNQNLL